MNDAPSNCPENIREGQPYSGEGLTQAHEPLHDIWEGSEFLDDAIRMVDQPLVARRSQVNDREANFH